MFILCETRIFRHALVSVSKVIYKVEVRILCFCLSIGDLFNQLMRDDPSTVNGAEILMLGEMLTLPQNFG